jgi:hypothetical protein
MSQSQNDRQVRIPGPNDRNIADYCKKFGISPADERKLLKLLGKHAPLHEIHANSPNRSPRYR